MNKKLKKTNFVLSHPSEGIALAQVMQAVPQLYLRMNEGEKALDFIKNKMSGLLTPDVQEKIIGSAEILEIFKVSKVGKVAGSKVIEGEILQDSNARVIRDGTIIFNGKIGSIYREKNQAKQVSAGLECGITIKDFNDFQKKDIIEVYNSTATERSI